MQGLWKDNRSNFLKDKIVGIYKREKNVGNIEKIYGKDFNSEYFDFYKSIEVESKKVKVLINVFRVKAFQIIFDFKAIKNCDSCPFKIYEDDGFIRRCNSFKYLDAIKLHKSYSKKMNIINQFAQTNSYCKKNDNEIGLITNEKVMFVYSDIYTYDYPVYIDYFSKQIIEDWVIPRTDNYYNSKHKKGHGLIHGTLIKDYSFEVELTQKTIEKEYTRSRKSAKIYNDPLDNIFFKRFQKSKRNCFCKKYANKKTRINGKKYTKEILCDTEIFFEKVEDNHIYEKSIGWCVS